MITTPSSRRKIGMNSGFVNLTIPCSLYPLQVQHQQRTFIIDRAGRFFQPTNHHLFLSENDSFSFVSIHDNDFGASLMRKMNPSRGLLTSIEPTAAGCWKWTFYYVFRSSCYGERSCIFHGATDDIPLCQISDAFSAG